MKLSDEPIIIIGGGPGGYSAALEIRKKFTAQRIILIEKNKLGGACLHVGCIPSKQLHSIEKLEDFPKLLAKNKMILEKGIASELKAANIEVIFDQAKLEDNKVTLSNGTELEYSHLVIATGSKPRTLKEFPRALTSDTFFSDENLVRLFSNGNLSGKLPDARHASFENAELTETSMSSSRNEHNNADGTLQAGSKYCFIGGGYIGVELASMLAYHGKQVRIIEVQDNILSFLDKDIHAKLMQSLKSQKIKIETGVKDLSSIVLEPGEEVFVSVGREPSFLSNAQDLRPNTYIIGDASQEIALAHYAYAQAKQLAARLAGESYEIDKAKVPLVIFTHPEVASIGLTELQAKQKYGDALETKIVNWASNGKARVSGYDRGMTKWIIHDDRVVGCHVIGEHATDLISIVVPIINMNLSISEMQHWIYPHPTLGEIFVF